MDVDLRCLRAFVEIAHTMSFSRAAEHMSLTQPQLSTRIRTLEARVGFRLFDRSSRRVALSAPGAALLAEAEAVVGGADAWCAHADILRLTIANAALPLTAGPDVLPGTVKQRPSGGGAISPV